MHNILYKFDNTQRDGLSLILVTVFVRDLHFSLHRSRQIQPHAIPFYIFKIYFNIILPSALTAIYVLILVLHLFLTCFLDTHVRFVSYSLRYFEKGANYAAPHYPDFSCLFPVILRLSTSARVLGSSNDVCPECLLSRISVFVI